MTAQKPPPCKRCGKRDWRTETRRKSVPRWLIETVFAIPDVLIYQSESAGWPSRAYERWTCTNCGRTVRVAV
ncbi:MAG TPA: hypothetical protein VMT90_10090 [Dehalococcoidia bacterium]|nr:hypothetical protein [Dehalococcoidia bacterium]